MKQASPRAALTDSPWYWVYLFCTAALIALLLVGPRFSARQSQIERKSQARQRAARQASGLEPDTPLSSEKETIITLRPLYAVFVLLLSLAGIALWRERRRRRLRPSSEVRP